MPAYFVGMGSGNDPVASTKVKRNVFLKDCSSDDSQCSRNDKRSRMIASDGRSTVLNNRPKCRPTPNKSSANIIVINGAWMQGAPPKHNANAAFYGGVNEVALHTHNLENNGSWIYQDQNSEGDINIGLELAKPKLETDSVETDVNYSDDSLTSLSDYSPVPFRSFDTRSEDDRDTKSLSWLVNFNVHSLVNPGGMRNNHTPQQDLEASTSLQDNVEMRASPVPPSALPVYQGVDQVGLCSSDSKSNTRKFHQGQPTLKPLSKPPSHGVLKPPFTYSELIEKALAETGELTVSELYHWISFHFPFYQPNDDRWKNSVRHNLSINPHFRKGRKSSQGAGHLWSLAPSYVKKGDADMEARPKKQNCQYATDIHVVSLQEVEAATASIEEDKENRQLPPNDVYYFDSGCYSEMGEKVEDEEYAITILGPSDDSGLVQTAEEILNGVKKDVEVQYVLPGQEGSIQVVNGNNASDFLNPVSMQEVVEECGLGYHLGATGIGADGTSFMITDINPETLGINIVETITPDLFSDNETIDIS